MNQKVYLDIIAGTTALGRIEIELFYDITPKTAENFRGLCTGEYGTGKIHKKKLTYKGSRIHKIIENQYIQGGDIIYGNGKGGESIYGEFFKDENFKRRHACAGLLSMGNIGRNTNSSQFIITLRPCPQLDDKHVVFGQVINGMEVVREIGKIPTDANERPRVKILIFDCGDYDTRRIHLREDVFKETIQSILEDRARKEKVKLLGPEEAEKYKKQKQKSAFDIEQEYPEEDTIKKNESEDEDSEEEEEEDEIDEAEIKKSISNIKNEKDKEDFMKQYYLLKSKITEAKNLNNKAVIEENTNVQDVDKARKLKRQEWLQEREKTKKKLIEQGVPENKLYTLESIHRNELQKEQALKKAKNETFGWDVFNNEAYYRAHKKRLRDMPFDKELYEEQMKNGIDMSKIDTEERKNLLKNDIEQQQEKRNNFSRRRNFYEDQNVDYINERNRKFNKKLERFFGKDSAEIKANLERGTAI